MNWKNEAIEKLRSYEAKKRSLENMPLEKQRLESAFTSMGSADTDRTPVMGGGSHHEDAMLSNIVNRNELAHARKQAWLWVKMVDNALTALDDRERRVLELMYMRRAKGNVERLCGEFGVEKSQVYAIKDNALRLFTLALYGITED